MLLLNVFIVSTIAAMFLLSVKIGEIKNSRQSFVGRLISKADPFINGVVKYLNGLFNYCRERTFFIFLVHVPTRIESFFKDIKHRSHGYYHAANVKIRGKRELVDTTASPYLRSMSSLRDVSK